MNKLEGFFELKSTSLPTVDWQLYRKGRTVFNDKFLWTVRCAVTCGEDFNLPRAIGVTAEKAEKFALSVCEKYGDDGMIICYPYFVADVSGTLCVSNEKTEIECVKGDLWNLVTLGKPDTSAVFSVSGEQLKAFGDDVFAKEVNEVLLNAKRIRADFRREILCGSTIYTEWSFARKCDTEGTPYGESKLVFYELRTVK